MSEILEACRDLPVDRYPKGTALIQEGTASNRLFVLVEGEVSVRKGEVEVARSAEPGSIFGEISVLLGVATTARVEARSDVRVHVIDMETTDLKQAPELLLHIARTLAQRLLDATGYLADIKRQFEGSTDHFGMVDQVLETLLQQQERWKGRGPEVGGAEPREDDSRL